MAILRDDPYGAFNFLVEIDGVTSAGFSEVSGLSTEIAVIEYRNGNDKVSSVRKLPGLHKAGNVTLKRGVTGDTVLFEWLRTSAQGSGDSARNIAIILLDEARQPVLCWLLLRAWPMKWEGPTLNASSNEIAIESLTLACDRIEID